MLIQKTLGWSCMVGGTTGACVGIICCQVDSISGGAGWASFGIAGLVLAWLLLKHLPSKDAQMEKKDQQIMTLLDIKDRQIIEQRAELTAALKESQEVYKQDMEAQRVASTTSLREAEAACKSNFSTLADAMKSSNSAMVESIKATLDQQAVRNQQFWDLIQRQLDRDERKKRSVERGEQ